MSPLLTKRARLLVWTQGASSHPRGPLERASTTIKEGVNLSARPSRKKVPFRYGRGQVREETPPISRVAGRWFDCTAINMLWRASVQKAPRHAMTPGQRGIRLNYASE
jgi:hypothetical protein